VPLEGVERNVPRRGARVVFVSHQPRQRVGPRLPPPPPHTPSAAFRINVTSTALGPCAFQNKCRVTMGRRFRRGTEWHRGLRAAVSASQMFVPDDIGVVVRSSVSWLAAGRHGIPGTIVLPGTLCDACKHRFCLWSRAQVITHAASLELLWLSPFSPLQVQTPPSHSKREAIQLETQT